MCLHFLHDTRFIFIYICIHHTHAVTSTKKRNIARSLNRWLINQPSFSSVFIHESRGDARHCGSRAGKLSPSRDTTVFTPSKHNGLSRFPVIFFLFSSSSFLRQTFIIRHFSIPEKDSFSKLLNFVVGGKIQRCWVTLLFPSLPHPFHHDPCCSSFPFI